MSRIAKRIFSTFLVSVIVLSTGVVAFASETPSSAESIRSIIETVNHKYGVHFYIPDELLSKKDECKLQISSSPADTQVISESTIRSANLSSSDLKTFETELRQSAKLIAKANSDSNAAWKNDIANNDQTIKGNSLLIQSDGIRLAKSGKKNITGGIAKFEGWANNYKGYWAWEYCNTASADMDYNDNKYRFSFDSYTYKLSDANRTCGVKYKGTLYTRILTFWVPSDSTQYVEWWAGMST